MCEHRFYAESVHVNCKHVCACVYVCVSVCVCAVYDMSDRGRVVGRLRRIGEALRRCKKLDNPRISIIPRARIPIIKVRGGQTTRRYQQRTAEQYWQRDQQPAAGIGGIIKVRGGQTTAPQLAVIWQPSSNGSGQRPAAGA